MILAMPQNIHASLGYYWACVFSCRKVALVVTFFFLLSIFSPYITFYYLCLYRHKRDKYSIYKDLTHAAKMPLRDDMDATHDPAPSASSPPHGGSDRLSA